VPGLTSDKNRKTVLVTGASSGIGCATVKLFLANGWNAVALSRDLEKMQMCFPASQCLLLSATDISDGSQVRNSVAAALDRFGRIDVAVNNAGTGITGPFELLTDLQIRTHFETAFFGHLNVIRSVIPIMRLQESGVIVNVTSEAGRIGFPFNSVYEAAKFGMEGFSESIRFELKQHGIRIKIVEPGQIKTEFSANSDVADDGNANDLYPVFNKIKKLMRDGSKGAKPETVAEVIYRAALSQSSKLRYPAASVMLKLFPFVPDRFVAFAMFKFLSRI
jgi:NAD(P)-dependent dehydrogenase (short-subunit alcohol dehydrogenase family)